ncbi:MAG: hypothetical protein AB1779_06905 [Candidatus Thermoplasmatota archaeon]
MDNEKLLRRIFHMSAIVFLFYYLLPDNLWIDFPKNLAVLIVLMFILFIEIFRLSTRKIFFGLRENEKVRMASYAWAALGLSIGFIFFPMKYVVPVIIGMAIVDPLIGELRNSKYKNLYPILPFAVYALILFIFLFQFSQSPLLILFALVGSFVALAVEFPKIKYIDDDFLLIFVPLAFLCGFELLLKNINWL